MVTRLWFLVQLAPRFAANTTLRHSVNVPLLARCNGTNRLLCSEQKQRRTPQVVSNPSPVADILNDKARERNTPPRTASHPISEF